MIRWGLAVFVGFATPAALACGFPDCDGDGFTVEQGDCDDTDPDVFPRARPEFDLDPAYCLDEIDNNCDGLFNEGCPGDVAMGRIGGGGACTDNGALGAAAVVVLPLVWRRRRGSRA